MQGNSRAIKAALRAQGLSQAKLAKSARVSQSTVSRLVKGLPEKQHGRARQKLLEYVRNEIPEALPEEDDPSRQLVIAFKKVWDETPEHAERIIQAVLKFGDALSTRRRGKRK